MLKLTARSSSPASAGIVGDGALPGSFVIRGTHTYAEEGGPFTVTAWLSDAAGHRVTTTTTADVVAPQALTRAGAPAVDATPSPTPIIGSAN